MRGVGEVGEGGFSKKEWEEMKFTVKRSEWYRGHTASSSYLRRVYDGQMCCLGFRALAVGTHIDDITGIRLPNGIRSEISLEQWKGLVVETDGIQEATPQCNTISVENDIFDRTPEDREARLTKLFAEIGDEIIFED